MQSTIYVETSIINYLTAPPSEDLLTAASQQITQEWWKKRRFNFQLYISSLVVKEAKYGEKEATRKRLQLLQCCIPLLEWQPEVLELADIFVKQKALVDSAKEDALHIAVATIHRLDYLLTWNCQSIANMEIQQKLAPICAEQGYEMPSICTPQTLMGNIMWHDSVVEEIHKGRAEQAERFNGDLKAIYGDLKEEQERCGLKLVSFPKRRKPSNAKEEPCRLLVPE